MTMTMRMKMKNLKKNKIVKDSNIQKLIEEPEDIKIPNWIDKNKFKKILIIIDSNKFGYKNKIGELKYIDNKDLVNNTRNNTVSEIDAKKRLNTSNIIKNSEIKHRKIIPGQKELLNLFDNLSDIILTDKTVGSQENKNENYENEDEDENEKLESKKEENEDYENKDEDDGDKTIDQNKIIKGKK